MKTKIVCDSSADLLKLDGVAFASAPLVISTKETSYVDDANLDVYKMVEELSEYKGRSYTACPSVDAWLNCFEDADVIYVCTITSGLSGAYNSAMVAVTQYLETHPNAKIKVFDSLTTGPELNLLAEKISEYVKEGLDFDTVCDKAQKYLSSTRLFFSLESLHNFVQNGRVSKIVASAAGILGIRIFGTASTEGTLEPMAKCRGDNKVINSLIAALENAGYKGGKIKIAHVQNLDFANRIKEALIKKFGNISLEIYETRGLCSYYAEKGGILVGCECI